MQTWTLVNTCEPTEMTLWDAFWVALLAIILCLWIILVLYRVIRGFIYFVGFIAYIFNKSIPKPII